MSKAHELDAGFDLESNQDLIIPAGGRHLVSTGTTLNIPEGHVGLLCSRSGLAAKHGVFVLNAPGIIDAGYSGEVKVALMNLGETSIAVKKGQRIAQLVVVPLSNVNPFRDVVGSERGNNGFGSTGGFGNVA